MQLKNGDIFAEHYQLKKLLGVGSFGEVWLARNILADVDVAIKLYGLLDDNGIKDFREEFKLAYKLHHPNLLHLNHFDVFGQCPFLVMPYCPKGSSASLKGKMSEKQIWRFIRDVSCGLMFHLILEYVHHSVGHNLPYLPIIQDQWIIHKHSSLKTIYRW